MNEYSPEKLKGLVEKFIAEKHITGYHYNGEEGKMLNFLNFVFDNQLTPSVSVMLKVVSSNR